MEKVEEIDLAHEIEATKNEMLQEKKAEVRRQIARILGGINGMNGTVRDLEQKLSKAKQSLEKQQNKLLELEKGNWSVLVEEKQEKETDKV